LFLNASRKTENTTAQRKKIKKEKIIKLLGQKKRDEDRGSGSKG